jgi:N6-L-threonylcarbamoyladenine synthase
VGRLLAIESSCDETAAAVVTTERRVLASVVATQIPVHARYGGVVPELASRSHMTAIRPVVERALAEAGCGLEEIDAVAVTTGPGLAGCLLVGVQVAKALAWTRGVPLVAVDHIAAHVDAVFLSDERGAGAVVPEFPYVALAVSGGHTSLARVEAPGELVLLGQTVDDAAGEAFDKVAKMMGLPYPGGVHIDRIAVDGDAAAVELPRPMLGQGLNFSFSGLKTAVRYLLEGAGGAGVSTADLAASAQEAIVDVLVAKAVAACRQEGLRDVVVAGGVACNSRLRVRMLAAAEAAGLRAHLTPARYCTDNAAMIGGLGAMLLARGEGVTGEALRRADIHVTQRPARRARRGA